MDIKAKNILFKTYWGSNGWLPTPKTESKDFAYAKAQGLMFEPTSIGHDQCLVDVLDMVKRITPAKAAQAFVSSLSTRRLVGGRVSLHIILPARWFFTITRRLFVAKATFQTVRLPPQVIHALFAAM